MADLDNPFGQGFSIEDTIEGAGNQEILSGLFGEETSTANPDELKEIVKEVVSPSPPPTPAKPKTSSTKPISLETEIVEDSAQNIVSSFMEQSDDPNIEPDTSNHNDESDENLGSPFSTLAKDLYKLEVFTKEEGEEEVEIKTPEQFLEKFNEEKKKGANKMIDEFLSQFGQDYVNAFQAIYVKGVDPKEYFGAYNKIVSFAELDLSNELNQETVVRQALIDQGYDAEDIATEIERIKNYGDLETVATKHHKVLVKKEAVKLQQLEQKAELELQTKNAMKNQFIQNVETVLQEKIKAKEFDGIPLNPKLANELHDFLLVDKYTTRTGETLTEFDKTILELKKPENHSMKVKLALILKILEKDPTLATIQRSGVTKKSEELFANTARQVSRDTTSINTGQTKWFT